MIHLEKSHKQLSQQADGERTSGKQRHYKQLAGDLLLFMVQSSEGATISQRCLFYMWKQSLRSPVSRDSSLSSWKERSKLTDLFIYFTVLLLLTSDCMGSLTHWGFSLPTTANAIHFNLSRGQWYFFWENLNFGEIFLWQMILKKGFCKAAENSYEHK